MTMTPVRVTRWSPQRNSRSFTSSGSDERRMSKRRWTAFDTLLTFWPPAPCARTALISTSASGMVMAIATLSRPRRERLAAIVFRDRLRPACGRVARNGVGRPIAIHARLLDREVARAWRAVLGRLALWAIFASACADVARRRHRILVGLHVLRGCRQCHGQANDQKRAFHGT